LSCRARARLRPALGIAALLATACGPAGPSRESPAVLLVTIDTLPADRVGCYGCPFVRTPVLDRLGRSGVQVRDAISPAPLTLPSHATLLTGLLPPEHGARENGLFVVGPEVRTVPERLPRGTSAAAFVAAFPLRARFGLDQGFDPYDDDLPRPADRSGPAERHAAEVVSRAAAWFESLDVAARPFAWVHLFDPHYAYAPPPPWREAAETIAPGGAYEGEVAYADRELGRLRQRVEATGRDLAVLVVADHGESLGSHGEITHGIFVYDATQRVPMIWSAPRVPSRLETSQRTLADVAPTLLEALGADHADLAGIPLGIPGPGAEGYVETKHTELLRGWAPLHGVRTGEWKYVQAPRPELYDLRADPGETRNVIDEHPDVVARLAARVADALARDVGAAATPLDEGTAEQLRSLGYVATADPAAFDRRKDPKDGVAGATALFRGEEAYVARDFEAALLLLEEAVRLDPTAKEAHAFLAGTYAELRRYDLAVSHARRALELPPHLNEGPLHATLGGALLALGRAEEALPELRAARDGRRPDPKLDRLLAEAEARAR